LHPITSQRLLGCPIKPFVMIGRKKNQPFIFHTDMHAFCFYLKIMLPLTTSICMCLSCHSISGVAYFGGSSTICVKIRCSISDLVGLVFAPTSSATNSRVRAVKYQFSLVEGASYFGSLTKLIPSF